jgi:hypothetical protein
MKCDGCTMCCLLYPVPDMDIEVKEDCPHRKPGIGCDIYNERPQDCELCTCMYLQSEKILEDLKPSSCGVIFEKVTDAIIIGTKLKETPISELVKQQINLFAKDNISTIINSMDGNPTIFVVPGASRDDINKVMGERWLLTQPI